MREITINVGMAFRIEDADAGEVCFLCGETPYLRANQIVADLFIEGQKNGQMNIWTAVCPHCAETFMESING